MGLKTKGLLVTYNVKERHKTVFCFDMYGKLQFSPTGPNKKMKYYYYPGILDSYPYYNISKGLMFIGTQNPIDFGKVFKYCTKFEVASTETSEYDTLLKTGRTRKKEYYKELGYDYVRNLE